MKSVVRVPGKLMLAGEYAAVFPGNSALAVAVDVPMTVTVFPAERATFSSNHVGASALPFSWQSPATGYAFFDAVVARLLPFLAERDLAITTHSVDVDYHPLLSQGEKIGLGSSASFVVGISFAVCSLFAERLGPNWRRDALWLALSAHLAVQGFRGSGYDVVTAACGGVVEVRYDGGRPLATLARHGQGAEGAGAGGMPPDLTIRRHRWPEGLSAVVVASGRASSTSNRLRETEGLAVDALATAARDVADAFRTEATGAVLRSLDAAQRAFEGWDETHGLGLMTKELRAIADVARAFGAVPRVSGAGGGDSMLVLSHDACRLQEACHALQTEGYRLMPVAVADAGPMMLAEKEHA